jgi:peptidoglycan/LPS O-acetylase OafA/YrhL
VGISDGMPIVTVLFGKGMLFMAQRFRKSGYIFTDKKNPRWGIMSTLLGLIAVVSVVLAVYCTYLDKGNAPMQYGMVVLLSVIYAMTGMLLGVKSLLEKDIFKLFPIMGIVLNVLAVLAGGFILYLGY